MAIADDLDETPPIYDENGKRTDHGATDVLNSSQVPISVAHHFEAIKLANMLVNDQDYKVNKSKANKGSKNLVKMNGYPIIKTNESTDTMYSP